MRATTPERAVPGGRQRSRRMRWMALLAMAAAATYPFVELTTPGDPGRLTSPLILTLVPLHILIWYSPFAKGSWWAGSPALDQGDEFERTVLSDAARNALIGTTAIAGLLFGWLAAATGMGWPVPSLARHWIAFGMAFLNITVAMPIVIAEFVVPFPPHADPEDDA